MEEIYIDYNGINHLESELDNCAEIIRTDSKKILEYVSEINNVWKGTAANIFSSRISEYAEAFQDCYNKLDKDAETLRLSGKAYKKFETHYLNKKI